jgi:heat-inducible transcriptional repressor
MSDLDLRKQQILRAIVVEYIFGAEPIASDTLVQKYDLGVKSATVRNELAEMSELGLLEQPHTSAGRIPSDAGYRFYVDRLVVEKPVSETHHKSIQNASGDVDALYGLLRETVRALSRASNQLGVATTQKNLTITVKTVVISALGPSQALLVIALSNGHIENRMIECPKNLTLQDIATANELLSVGIINKDLKSLTKIKSPTKPENPPVEKLLSVIWTHLRAIAKQLTRGKLITEGEEYLFTKPEFQRDSASLSELFHQLDKSDLLYETISPQTNIITIGKENKSEQFHRFSVVRKSYFIGEHEIGTIAIVGPTRMDYDADIPLVNFTANVLSKSLTKFFG